MVWFDSDLIGVKCSRMLSSEDEALINLRTTRRVLSVRVAMLTVDEIYRRPLEYNVWQTLRLPGQGAPTPIQPKLLPLCIRWRKARFGQWDRRRHCRRPDDRLAEK